MSIQIYLGDHFRDEPIWDATCFHSYGAYHQLSKTVGPSFALPDGYRRLIGKLIYLIVTHLKLAYAIYTLAQFMHAPQKYHRDAAFRVVRYLKCHLEKESLFLPISHFIFVLIVILIRPAVPLPRVQLLDTLSLWVVLLFFENQETTYCFLLLCRS